jgi:hypothetical protein
LLPDAQACTESHLAERQKSVARQPPAFTAALSRKLPSTLIRATTHLAQ